MLFTIYLVIVWMYKNVQHKEGILLGVLMLTRFGPQTTVEYEGFFPCCSTTVSVSILISSALAILAMEPWLDGDLMEVTLGLVGVRLDLSLATLVSDLTLYWATR